MQLLTAEILKNFNRIGSQEHEPDPLVICKFFDPCSQRTRFVTEYDEETGLFFGLVEGVVTERGYFSLDELKSIRGALGIGIERDLHFKPTRVSQLRIDRRF